MFECFFACDGIDLIKQTKLIKMKEKKSTKKRKSTGAVTINDVAKFAGVGAMSVSRVLREPEKVSAKLRDKIEHAISFLGYTQNIAASALASAQKNKLIILLVDTFAIDANAFIINHIKNQLIKADYIAIAIETYNYKNKIDFIKMLKQYNPVLIVILNIDEKFDADSKKQIGLLASPHIFLDFSLDTHNTLAEMNKNAMYALTDSIIKKGYQNIGLLCANHSLPIFKQRLNGWHKAMLDNHLSTHRVINAMQAPSFLTGSELLPDFLLNWPEIDMLICTTDDLAIGVINECHRRKIKVPSELAVAGVGHSEYGYVSFPSLTTIELPYKALAKILIKKIIHTLKTQNDDFSYGNHMVDYKKSIIWRGSTK